MQQASALTQCATSDDTWQSIVRIHGLYATDIACDYINGKMSGHYPVPSIYCLSLISRKVDRKACDINTIDMLWDLAFR